MIKGAESIQDELAVIVWASFGIEVIRRHVESVQKKTENEL